MDVYITKSGWEKLKAKMPEESDEVLRVFAKALIKHQERTHHLMCNNCFTFDKENSYAIEDGDNTGATGGDTENGGDSERSNSERRHPSQGTEVSQAPPVQE